MKFGIGDQVGFLDENLEGKVTRLLSDDILRVEVDGGLEFDVHASKLVLVKKRAEPDIPSASKMAAPVIELAKSPDRPFEPLEDKVFYFVVSPGEDMQVLTGPVRFYLVNKLPYDAYYSFSARIGPVQHSLSTGTVKAGTEIMLSEHKREELLDWKHLNLQAIFVRDGSYSILPPLNKELALELPDLQVANNRLAAQWRYSKVRPLVSSDLKPPDLTEIKKRFAPETETPKETRKVARKPPRPSPEAVLINESEIDLHIQCLADDYLKLSNSEILQIQMRRFRQEMDRAMKEHYKKITFIHGVGNGVLRNELLRELRTFSGLVFHDAPFEKYGYGATEVVFI